MDRETGMDNEDDYMEALSTENYSPDVIFFTLVHVHGN